MTENIVCLIASLNIENGGRGGGVSFFAYAAHFFLSVTSNRRISANSFVQQCLSFGEITKYQEPMDNAILDVLLRS